MDACLEGLTFHKPGRISFVQRPRLVKKCLKMGKRYVIIAKVMSHSP